MRPAEFLCAEDDPIAWVRCSVAPTPDAALEIASEHLGLRGADYDDEEWEFRLQHVRARSAEPCYGGCDSSARCCCGLETTADDPGGFAYWRLEVIA